MTTSRDGKILAVVRLVGLIAFVGWIGAARAQNTSDADRLFVEGRALRDQGRFVEACARFVESSKLERSPSTQLNLGECAERDGQLRRAWLLYCDAADSFERRRKAAVLERSPEAERAEAGAKYARDHAEALVPKLAKLVIRIAEPRLDGLAVRIDGRAVPAAVEIVEMLDPGRITITASANHRKQFSQAVRAEHGTRTVIEIPALAAEDRVPIVEIKRRPSRVRLAIGLGASGLALVAASVGVGLAARAQNDRAESTCTRDATGQLQCGAEALADIASAGRTADLATYIGIAGAAFVVTSIVVYVTAPRARIAITPTASADAIGVTISGRF